ncbi:hypothetical protein [Paenibacillus hexagrammi]|uniref:Addiction module antitoxin, RelB/DinJ family n=1 Tax=Paenibacillus hexagrammi TaxID=2908839 RepID=A0ABY3SHK0_9BACL|nr:hypothetical protein [Paenibacillus sp. YPD9-1]UJF32671.1 hypothetical protein L0M14_24095 [Paenibacillus sp. YPD9-1]
MANIEINIDDDTLLEAEKILLSLGMNVEIALNIFLRRVSLEKGFPMTMAASTPNLIDFSDFEDIGETSVYETKPFSRSNIKITPAMVEDLWRAFLRYVAGTGEINRLSTEVAETTGMSRGSAFIYLMVLANLVNGEPNTRVLKYKDLEFLMGNIKTQLGESKYQKAILSLKRSIPYWRENPWCFCR